MQYLKTCGFMMLAAGLICGCTSDKGAVMVKPEPAVKLIDTYWRLVSLDGVPVASAAGARQAYLMLRAEGNHLSAVGGVNQMGGAYELKGDSIKVTPGAMTRMAGPEPLMKQEGQFVQLLTKVDRYAIDGNRLTLFGGQKALLVFEAAPQL